MFQSVALAIKGAQLVVELAGIRAGNTVLILCDKDRWMEGEALAGACHAAGAEPLLVDLTILAAWYYNYLKRPRLPANLVAAMNGSDFTLAAGDNEFCHMIGHLDENRAAQNRGMRWVSVEDRMCEWRTDLADIERFTARTHRITEMLSGAKKVRVTTAAGTDVSMPCKAGLAAISFVPRGGKKGEIVPNYAESAMVPQEWQAVGRAVIDGIIIGLGEMRDDPVTCDIEKGAIVRVSGGANARRFQRFLDDSGENAGAISELGVATSHVERRAYEYVTGRPGHRAYGAWGSSHLGIGNGTAIGGSIKSAIHVDCQMYDTTVEIDGQVVMERGRYPF